MKTRRSFIAGLFGAALLPWASKLAAVIPKSKNCIEGPARHVGKSPIIRHHEVVTYKYTGHIDIDANLKLKEEIARLHEKDVREAMESIHPQLIEDFDKARRKAAFANKNTR